MPLSTCEDEEEEEEASKAPTGGPPPGTPTAAPEQAVTLVSAPPRPPSLWLSGGREVSILSQEQLPPSQPQMPIQLVRTSKGAGGGGTNYSSCHGGSMQRGQGSRYLSRPRYLVACPGRTFSGRMAKAGRGCWEEGQWLPRHWARGFRGDVSFRRGVRASVTVPGRMTVVGQKGF